MIDRLAIFIESSHKRGMGHLFRAMNISNYIHKIGIDSIIILNDDSKSEQVLSNHGLEYVAVDDINDIKKIVGILANRKMNNVIIDRFSSDISFTKSLKSNDIFVIGIDDIGDGSREFDIHFCPLVFGEKCGHIIIDSSKYLIINPEIKEYRRERVECKKILVSMGGSDTYGVTVRVVESLKRIGINADLLIGPGFIHYDELESVNCGQFKLYHNVPSLARFMNDYDFLICGGGMTCIEAAASGLPSIIIANEIHEVEIGKWMEQSGGCVFAGYYKDDPYLALSNLHNYDLNGMSKKLLDNYDCDGLSRFINKINELFDARQVT